MVALTLGPHQVRFIAFLACIALAVAGGYVLRRVRLAKAEWAKPIMSAAIIGCDAPIAWLAIWHLSIRPAGESAAAGAALAPEEVWKVPAAGAIVAVAVCLAGLWVARRAGLAARDQAVFGLQSGMGNVGYTLGGSLCFAVWGVHGLALEQLFCMMWPFFAFLFCFPVGRHYAERSALASGGEAAGEGVSAGRWAARLVLRSLTDLRSLPLYLATLGLVLRLRNVEPPPEIERWHVIDLLMVLGIFMQFGGVGMTVRARRLPVFWKPALGVAALKMALSPALMLAVAAALGLAGVPLQVCLLLAAMPTALYSVLIANVFDLNADLANTTFVLTHLVCLVVMVPALAVWVM